jgi:hypothetical protein
MTLSGDRRQALLKEAREMASDSRALQKAAVHPRLAWKRKSSKARRKRPWLRPRP